MSSTTDELHRRGGVAACSLVHSALSRRRALVYSAALAFASLIAVTFLTARPQPVLVFSVRGYGRSFYNGIAHQGWGSFGDRCRTSYDCYIGLGCHEQHCGLNLLCSHIIQGIPPVLLKRAGSATMQELFPVLFKCTTPDGKHTDRSQLKGLLKELTTNMAANAAKCYVDVDVTQGDPATSELEQYIPKVEPESYLYSATDELSELPHPGRPTVQSLLKVDEESLAAIYAYLGVPISPADDPNFEAVLLKYDEWLAASEGTEGLEATDKSALPHAIEKGFQWPSFQWPWQRGGGRRGGSKDGDGTAGSGRVGLPSLPNLKDMIFSQMRSAFVTAICKKVADVVLPVVNGSDVSEKLNKAGHNFCKGMLGDMLKATNEHCCELRMVPQDDAENGCSDDSYPPDWKPNMQVPPQEYGPNGIERPPQLWDLTEQEFTQALLEEMWRPIMIANEREAQRQRVNSPYRRPRPADGASTVSKAVVGVLSAGALAAFGGSALLVGSTVRGYAMVSQLAKVAVLATVRR
mmetsp:Transcript_25054/g.64697  ORF Transcript_25054/g.64697 Transcript_25054/m.64697 type:complete len:521 (+) Transcript_25054:42-1604(+)